MSSKVLMKPSIISVVFLGIILLGVAGCIFGAQRGSKITSDETTPPSITVSPLAAPQLSPTDSVPGPGKTEDATIGWVNFKHPIVGYIMEYPASWSGGLIETPEAIVQDYQDFFIKSPDHRVSGGYPVLEKGAELFVRVEKTQHSTIGEIFNNDLLAQEIAFNRTSTTVDGLEAIQYDYSYEGHRATMTIFSKNGHYYTVKYRYVDNDSRQKNWDEYMRLLDSFIAE